ncbi:MAG: helix-turn-helix domain-containing protein [Clostridium sp.]|nr:helix-turn-helix domain-containing protein [Clostridium sp.]
MIELGKKIKMVREYNDLSQEELGTIVQKTKSTIGRYEKGLMEIPAKVIIDLCNYYQLSLDAFVESTYYAGHQAHMEKNTELKRGGLAALDPSSWSITSICCRTAPKQPYSPTWRSRWLPAPPRT